MVLELMALSPGFPQFSAHYILWSLMDHFSIRHYYTFSPMNNSAWNNSCSKSPVWESSWGRQGSITAGPSTQQSSMVQRAEAQPTVFQPRQPRRWGIPQLCELQKEASTEEVRAVKVLEPLPPEVGASRPRITSWTDHLSACRGEWETGRVVSATPGGHFWASPTALFPLNFLLFFKWRSYTSSLSFY